MEPSRGGSDPDTATGEMRRSSSSSSGKSHPKSSSLDQSTNTTCPITGASHTNLFDFGIHICPRCDFHIIEEDTDGEAETGTSRDTGTLQSSSDVLKSRSLSIGAEIIAQLKSVNEVVGLLAINMKQYESGTESEGSDRDSDDEEQQSTSTGKRESEYKDRHRNKIDSIDTTDTPEAIQGDNKKEGRPSGIYHDVEFEDSGGNRLHKRRWNKQFNLEEARKGVGSRGKKATAKVSTILKTDIKDDDYRTEKERVRITKAGFLRNPGVDFITMYQVMEIKSKEVIDTLRALVRYYPGVSLERHPIYLVSPFCIIAHHIKELEAYKQALSDSQQLTLSSESTGELSEVQRVGTINHLGQLLDFMKTNMFSRQIVAEQARHAQSPPLCTFSTLWLLYKPGTTVYVRDETGKTRAYVLMSVHLDKEVSANFERSRPYVVELWSLSYDGTQVRRSQSEMTIGSFYGERRVVDLNIIPASFIDKEDGGKQGKT
ncbi:hypothetical protein PG984_010082 [Apiospora sp. TS-2023a]